jgi:hypothetical protein
MKVEALGELIEKSNEAFNKMSDAEKRVEVAKDTLARIAIKQMVGFRGATIARMDSLKKDYPGGLKNTINTNDEFTCQVCARGAMFMSYVGRVNEVDFSTLTDETNDGDAPINTKLAEIFSFEQIALIETAFEGGRYLFVTKKLHGRNVDIDQELLAKARLFRENYSIDTDRLVAICENIIENEGTFNP